MKNNIIEFPRSDIEDLPTIVVCPVCEGDKFQMFEFQEEGFVVACADYDCGTIIAGGEYDAL